MEDTENDCLSSEDEENEGDNTLPSMCDIKSHGNPAPDGEILSPKNKRKRTYVRRKIRKIMSPEQLDSETVSAQKEEQERLRRLELQRSLSEHGIGDVIVEEEQSLSTPPLSGSPLDTSNIRQRVSPVFVDVPNKQPSSIIVIDDSDDDSDVVESSCFRPDPIIEISDSGSDSDVDITHVDEEREPETSGSHTNDDVNLPDAQGRVLVNVNHPPTEPDIFLSPYLSRCVKPHQIGGIRFLYDNLVESLSRFNVSPGLGCILAHSMGLGKTLQLICFIEVLLTFTKATKVLCIVPMNTIQNWYSEFDTWLPEEPPDEQPEEGVEDGATADAQNEPPKTRKYKVFLLSENVKTTASRSELIGKWHQNGGVLLMGYEMYRILVMYSPSLVNNAKLTGNKRKKPSSSSTSTEVIDLDEEEKNMDLLLGIQRAICKPGPDLVVCDEGHRIKNNQANVSLALKKIQTRRRVVLTGYPLQNNLLEYWCMVDFVRPNFLGTRHEFSNMFERPIVNGQCMDSTASDIKLMRFRAHVLHSLLEGFVQRRSEAVLKKTLPEKEEYVIPVKMSPIQMSLYGAFVSSVRNYVGYVNPIRAFSISIKIWNHPDILKRYLDSKKNGARNDSPLTVVDPDLDIGENLTKKTKSEVSRRAMNQDGGPAPTEVRASLANSGDWVGNLLDDYEPDVLQNGSKTVILTEIIEKTVAMGDKLLVFSQSLSTLSLIEDFLRKRVVPPRPSQLLFQPVHWERNKNYYRLDGGTSSQEREKLIRAFNLKTNQSVFVFLLSTRACSLGVNLVGANRVVVFDASWNPCHDAQAICRIYRYGQVKKCFIYRLVSSGTFEKRMYERQVTKQGMSDRVIDELNPQANLTKQEVMSLFNETEPEVKESKKDGSSSSSSDKFADPVLNHVCEMVGKSIASTPFKHKLQTSQRSRSTLTKAEKREAKKGYELEKRAISSANRCVPLPGESSALIRELMRREAISRPVGHVIPIPNVQANNAPSSRIPPNLPLPVPPSFAHRYMNNLPSMAFTPQVSYTPMPYARYLPPGELRPLPPFPVHLPVSSGNSGMRRVGNANPVVVSLLASPERDDADRTPSDYVKGEVEEITKSACVDRRCDAVVDVKAAGAYRYSFNGPPVSAILAEKDTRQSFAVNLSTCSVPVNPLMSRFPVNPSMSSVPVNPSTFSVPVNPSTFSVPVNPLMSSVPVNPLMSSVPVNPSTSCVPVNPSTSSVPVNPSTSSIPVNPSTFSEPVNPSTSSVPINPSTSSVPVHPSTSSVPVYPSTSSVPVHPSTSSVPDANQSRVSTLCDIEPSTSISVHPSTCVVADDSLSACHAVPGENGAGRSSPDVTVEQSSNPQRVMDNAEENMECGELVTEMKPDQGPSCPEDVTKALT